MPPTLTMKKSRLDKKQNLNYVGFVRDEYLGDAPIPFFPILSLSTHDRFSLPKEWREKFVYKLKNECPQVANQ